MPTAATIEHKEARSAGGGHDLTNLVLACPDCNSRRGDIPYDQWVASRAWAMPWPKDLPLDVTQMVAETFKAKRRGAYIWTESTNARVYFPESSDNVQQIILQVRAGRDWEWHDVVLGPDGDKRTVYGVYDFLRRHLTPYLQ